MVNCVTINKVFLKGLGMDFDEVAREVYRLIDTLKPEERVGLIENLYTANLTGETILDPGSKAVRFHHLCYGEQFIWMPSPEDGNGMGGLGERLFVFKKIKDTRNQRVEDQFFNSARVWDEKIFSVPYVAWVLRIQG